MDARLARPYAGTTHTRKGKTMKPIKTIVAACLAAVALSVGALSLGACGPSAEEVVRQGVADELERIAADPNLRHLLELNK